MPRSLILPALASLLAALATFGVAGSVAQASGVVVIDASPDTDTNLVGEDHTITAVVTDNGTPSQGWDVSFNVQSGPNAGDGGQDTTDSNGEATFTYTGDGGQGTDSIEVCVLGVIIQGVSASGNGQPLDCEIVEKTWVEPTPTPTPTPEPTPTPAATATPTATPAEAAPAAELPETGSQPPSGGGLPWLGVMALALGGATLLAGGWALSRRSG